MEVDKIGVHTSHCCLNHGCKYGNTDCPVEFGGLKQEYPCAYCVWDSEDENDLWISDLENTPELGKKVLVTFQTGEFKQVGIAVLVEDLKILKFWSVDGDTTKGEVIAWREMPKPYDESIKQREF